MLISSNKGHIGHCFSSAGTIETILGLEAMKEGVLLPTNGFREFDEEFKEFDIQRFLDISSEYKELPKGLSFMLKNSFGFGGVNNSLLFRKLR